MKTFDGLSFDQSVFLTTKTQLNFVHVETWSSAGILPATTIREQDAPTTIREQDAPTTIREHLAPTTHKKLWFSK